MHPSSDQDYIARALIIASRALLRASYAAEGIKGCDDLASDIIQIEYEVARVMREIERPRPYRKTLDQK